MSVALCLLTWNEIEGCRLDVPEIDMSKFDQIYAVDGGSNDGTIKYLEDLDIDVYVQPIKGYNQAYIHAFNMCKCDYLVLFHPKGSVSVSDLYKFRDYFNDGYSLVVASRIINGAQNEEDAHFLKPRKWFVEIIGLASYIVWGKFKKKILWDVLHGFRGMKKKDFLEMDALTEGLSVDLEMVVRSYRRGIPYIEFPTQEKARLHGETHFKAFATGKVLLKYLWLELFRSA